MFCLKVVLWAAFPFNNTFFLQFNQIANKANYVLWLNSNVGGPEVKAIRQNIFAALESSDQIYHVRVKQPVDGLDKGMDHAGV